MALLGTFTNAYGQIKKFLETIREGQAPKQLSRQHLKDLGFKSSNHHPYIPLLKGMGFLNADGAPTPRYFDFMDKSKSKKILTDSVKDAYSDIFTLKANPTKNDRDIIEGKFKSTFNSTDEVAKLRANTFFALWELCDPTSTTPDSPITSSETNTPPTDLNHTPPPLHKPGSHGLEAGLHFNIQIHLPATKDIEVFNAIFKSLKDHLLE